MGAIIAVLTSRLAGPIAAGVGVLLAIALAVSQIQLHATRADLKAAGERIEALSRDLGTCRANTAALEASIRGQNAAVAAWKAEGDARAAEVAKARHATREKAARADRAAANLAALKPVGNDLCARMLAVDEAVKETSR